MKLLVSAAVGDASTCDVAENTFARPGQGTLYGMNVGNVGQHVGKRKLGDCSSDEDVNWAELNAMKRMKGDKDEMIDWKVNDLSNIVRKEDYENDNWFELNEMKRMKVDEDEVIRDKVKELSKSVSWKKEDDDQNADMRGPTRDLKKPGVHPNWDEFKMEAYKLSQDTMR